MTEEQSTTPKRGRGRPPKYDQSMKAMPAFHVPQEEAEYIQRMLVALDISWSDYARQAVTAYRKSHESALSMTNNRHYGASDALQDQMSRPPHERIDPYAPIDQSDRTDPRNYAEPHIHGWRCPLPCPLGAQHKSDHGVPPEPEWHRGCTGCWRTVWH